jgi:hypothetical protein
MVRLFRDESGEYIRYKKMQTQNDDMVVGVFHSQSQAQDAVQELRRLGFLETEIGVASKHESVDVASDGDEVGADAATGATTGVVAGLGVGALWGMGIAAGMLPAIGPVIAGGTLAAIAASAATGAATAGLAGALIGAGFSDADAQYYDDEFKQGRVIVTVHAGSRRAEAEDVMQQYEGYNRSTPV